MLPLILGVVGGYLIGDSIKDKKVFENGGDIYDNDINNDDIRKIVLKALSELSTPDYNVEEKYRPTYPTVYISSAKKSVLLDDDEEVFNVNFSYISDDGWRDTKLTVDGIDIDLNLFTEEEKVLIQYQFDGLEEQLDDYLRGDDGNYFYY